MNHEATRLLGMQVYTNQGTYLGTVEEVSLEVNLHSMDGLYLTETNGALIPEAANIIIPYRWVASFDDIILLRFFPRGLSFTEPEEELEVTVSPLTTEEELESLEYEFEDMEVAVETAMEADPAGARTIQ